MSLDAVKRHGFVEDLYQQGGKPRKPRPDQPMVSQNKAVLTLADMEHLRRMGAALVRRARELSETGVAPPRYVTLCGSKDDPDGSDGDPSQVSSQR